jgi:hypothetical protein
MGHDILGPHVTLSAVSLGCFERVDLCLLLRQIGNNMGCQIAAAVAPFLGWIGIGLAVPTG